MRVRTIITFILSVGSICTLIQFPCPMRTVRTPIIIRFTVSAKKPSGIANKQAPNLQMSIFWRNYAARAGNARLSRLVTAISRTYSPKLGNAPIFFCCRSSLRDEITRAFHGLCVTPTPRDFRSGIENMSFLSRTDIKLLRNFVSP